MLQSLKMSCFLCTLTKLELNSLLLTKFFCISVVVPSWGKPLLALWVYSGVHQQNCWHNSKWLCVEREGQDKACMVPAILPPSRLHSSVELPLCALPLCCPEPGCSGNRTLLQHDFWHILQQSALVKLHSASAGQDCAIINCLVGSFKMLFFSPELANWDFLKWQTEFRQFIMLPTRQPSDFFPPF